MRRTVNYFPDRPQRKLPTALCVNAVNPAVYSFNHDVTNTPIEGTARQHFSIVPRSAVGEFARKIARKQKVEISWMAQAGLVCEMR